MRSQPVAAAGALVWAASVALLQPPLAVALLLLGPLVATPLALGLAHPGGPSSPLAGRWRVVLLATVPAAALAATSFALPTGTSAALLVAPWLSVSMLVAALGLLRLLERGGRPLAELGIDAGLAFLAVGAFWLLVSRGGWTLAGFAEPIPFLTAAHFHFAGLALPILGTFAARALPGATTTAVVLALVAGMPLVAAGITLQQHGLEAPNLVAVAFFTAAATSLAILHARLAMRPGPAARRILLGLSACALPVGMALAFVYAWGRSGGPWSLDLDVMVRTHAVVNVVGFVLPALAAWSFFPPPRPAPAGLQVLLPWLGDRIKHGRWPERALHPGLSARRAGDQEDRTEVHLGNEPPGPPVAGGLFDRARAHVLAFDVFPRQVLRAHLMRVPLQAGDTVMASHPVAPGAAIAIGARVTEAFDGHTGEGWRAGFTYATLDGHPECGAETFAIEKDAAGDVRLVVTAWSRPGHPLTYAVRRWARRRQQHALEAMAAMWRHRSSEWAPAEVEP